MYAHAAARSPEQRRRGVEFIRSAFIDRMVARDDAWWLNAGGRSALDLAGLAYCLDTLGDEPELRVQMARAVAAMFSPESPTSMYRLMERRILTHDEWIYVCYGTVALVDVLQPGLSLDGLIVPNRGTQ